jgi:hypothetical protein
MYQLGGLHAKRQIAVADPVEGYSGCVSPKLPVKHKANALALAQSSVSRRGQ